MRCTICPRVCDAERPGGFCGMGELPVVSRAAPHFWEEPCISGERGSGAVFFAGCNLRCVFCQNYDISALRRGKEITVERLREIFEDLIAQGAHNINLVSPTPYIESIIELLSEYKPSVPIVYNTGGYEKAETLRRLEGIVDIYLPDLKYIDGEKSKKYSCAENYAGYAIPAIHEMVRQTGKPQFDENGIMLKGTIVRHLILPQNTKNSIKVLQTLQSEFGDSVLVSLMAQYIPMGRAADYPEIDRRITKREYEKVLEEYEILGLDGFVQERSSATQAFVPNWNLDNE